MIPSYIRIMKTENSYVTRAGDPSDQWDRDDTAADISVQGIMLSKPDHHFDIAVDFDVVPGREYWLVWADYSTGDSFGHDDNNFAEIDLFESPRRAAMCKESLLDKEYGTYTGKYRRENGIEVTISLPWTGYFERLNELHVQKVRII